MITRVFSGDQNLFWDAPLKIKVAESQGLEVTHLVHTADQFSRAPAQKKTPKSSDIAQEAYLPDGNLTHWAEMMESALFLGRAGLLPSEIGLDLKRLAKYRSEPYEQLVIEFSQADRWGVVLPQSEVLAHDVTLGEVKEGYNKLKKLMKRNLLWSLGHDPEISQKFEQAWQLYFGLDDLTLTIGEVYPKVLRRMIGQKVQVSTTLEYLQGKEKDILLRFWVEEYPKMLEIYNQSVEACGFQALRVKVGELPYYLLVNVNGKRIRQTLTLEKARTLESKSIIVPKAVMLLLKMLLENPLLLPENGSKYIVACKALARELKRLDSQFKFHQICWVKFNALDNLKGVQREFRVPEYLQPFFGERITGNKLASSWRKVCQEIEEELQIARQTKAVEWLKLKGQVSKEIWQEHELLVNRVASCHQTISKSEKALLEAQVRAFREEAYNQQCEFVVQALQAKNALSYWNSRPMYWWIHCIPGWEETVLENAEIEPEEIL